MAGFTLHPQGSFALKESVEFGFGQRHSERFTGSMRLAFVLDGNVEQVGVVLRQDPDAEVGAVHGDVHGDADPVLVERQVARILSLDHDGRPYDEVADRDPVVAKLQALHPGLRPPLFHSPYEAAVWAIISTRRQPEAAASVREALSRSAGRVFELEGEELAALPTPDQLLEVDAVAGLPQERLARLHALAAFARDGGLDADRLRAMGPEQATEWVQQAKGIGPFYASLIVVRAVGFTDVLVDREPRLLSLVQRLYGLEGPPDPGRLADLAQPWRPMRTWVAVLVRRAGAQLV